METINERLKALKQKLGEKIPCSIEVLTPVHVGSGVKLSEGIDFVKNSNSVHIVPQSELMQYLKDNPEEMERFIAGGYKLNALKSIPDGRRYTISIGRTNEINEFERNGNGKPYIPGSSIKGSIRTCLLKNIFERLSEIERNNLLRRVTSRNKEWASEPVVKDIFGEEPNKNLMRILEVFDVEYDEVVLEKVQILSLTNNAGTSYGWKQLWKKQNVENPNQASQIIVEALPINSKGYCSVSLNTFLLNNPVAKRTLDFREPLLSDVDALLKTINSYSKEILNSEREFFSKLRSPQPLTSVITEIDKLLEQINNLSKDECILRISWGSGWKGMTGDYLDDEWLTTFRQNYNLGKNGFLVFPKTRRIIFDEDETKYLTGWIRIKFNDTPKETIVKTSEKSLEHTNDPMELLKQKYTVKESKRK